MPNRLTTAKPPERAQQAKSRRRKKLPPGQRLILYFLFAMILVLFQARVNPIGVPMQSKDEPGQTVPIVQPFELRLCLAELTKELKTDCKKPKLSTGVFVIEPTTGRYIDVEAQKSYSAASMIKIPVLVALLIAEDKKQISPEQMLTIRQDLIGGGSGYLQWRKPGSKISVKETGDLMIKISDNTATNMIIDALGGIDKVNKSIASWGITKTQINNWLPDLEGTNKTSPYDLGYLLAKVEQGALLSKESKKYMYDLMEKTRTRTLLPMGLGPGAKISHKTGDIGKMIGDAGIVTCPSGTRYIIAVQVARPHNDHRAGCLVREISKTVYDSFAKMPAPHTAASESDDKLVPIEGDVVKVSF